LLRSEVRGQHGGDKQSRQGGDTGPCDALGSPVFSYVVTIDRVLGAVEEGSSNLENRGAKLCMT
jgi:hypothetical protein